MAMLSVITPARNMARFLPDTLDSVAALRTPHEHIVVDGDSDDGTVELLEGREDPHLTWISEPDSGQTEAVNKGLRLARGDLLAWVNADDAYIPEAVDRALEHLERNPGLGAIFGGGQLRRRARRGLPDPGAAEVQLADVPLLRRLRHHPDDHLAPRAARAGAVAERGATSDAADYDFYLRLLRGARVDRIDEPLLNFRYHPSQQDDDRRLGPARTRRRRSACAGRATRCSAGSCAAGRRARRAILPRISSWPHPEPRGVVKLLRRIGARG